MKRLILFIFLLLPIFGAYASDSAEVDIKRKNEAQFLGVRKINDDLYVGKVAEGFYLAMQRLTDQDRKMWLKYANMQVKSHGKQKKLKYLPDIDGSEHFARVLDDKEITLSDNELWVDYVSRVPVTRKASLILERPLQNPDIEMFVSIITTPDALITSHMGISRTVEAAVDLQQNPPRRTKHADQSVHLHSFAAKVMKMRDPKKQYMLTAPTPIMRTILIHKMPAHSVFVGDNLYQNKIEMAERDSFSLLDRYALEERKGEATQVRQERLKKKAASEYEWYGIAEKIVLLKSNPPRIIRTRSGSLTADENDDHAQQQSFTIQNVDDSSLATFDQSTRQYGWLFTEAYEDRGIDIPYVLIDLNALAQVAPLMAEKKSE